MENSLRLIPGKFLVAMAAMAAADSVLAGLLACGIAELLNMPLKF
jgi:hypothetical protein